MYKYYNNVFICLYVRKTNVCLKSSHEHVLAVDWFQAVWPSCGNLLLLHVTIGQSSGSHWIYIYMQMVCLHTWSERLNESVDGTNEDFPNALKAFGVKMFYLLS